MQKWEYLIVNPNFIGDEVLLFVNGELTSYPLTPGASDIARTQAFLSRTLNHYGDHGWELVAVNGNCIFKRPK